MITSYHKYKSAGFACVPTGNDKLPAIPKGSSWIGGWKNEHEYTKSFGIGLLAGKFSGNLECIDFDNHFGDAKQVFSEFYKMEGVKEIITKYKLPVESTTSGGYHLLYKCDLLEGNQKLASRLKKKEDGTERAEALIETRGEGGYFVVAPTPGYNVVLNDITNVGYITAEERGILLSSCRSFNKVVKTYNKPEENKDQPGEIFNNSPEALPAMVSALKKAGWDELTEGIWRRPGKKKGISATLGRAHPGIFYNFSSSGDPFEINKGYTAFQVVGLLEYGGDFKKFAGELHEKYDAKPAESKSKKSEDQLTDILKKALIDLTIPVAKPPVILRIKTRYRDDYTYSRVLTLGNFSAIIGKSKAKKTFFASLLLASATKTGELEQVFLADVPSSKRGVVLFDTEQSPYDAYRSAHRVWDIAGGQYENFGAFDLREYSPIERCDIIDCYLKKAGDKTSYLVIDGIADLALAINDEIEASRVTGLLMKWTKVYNLHITVIIHQNKNDNYATGHLGSSITKKAECVMSVAKDEYDNTISEVSCDYIRGAMEFDKFKFMINENGIPVVQFNNSVQRLNPLPLEEEECPFITD